MKKEAYDYIFAVDLLIDKLECMMEDEEYDEDKLLKRIQVVKKFKSKLEEKCK